MRYFTASLIILLLAGGCSFFNNRFEQIVGRFNVGYTNRKTFNVICENYTSEDDIGGLIIVPAYVFAVGHNDEFIIAKQHPIPGDDHEGEPDVTVTNYYVVDINRKFSKDLVVGPLNEVQFDSVRTAFNIASLQFDKQFPERP